MRSSFCYIHCVDQQPKSGLLRFIVDVSMSLTIMRFRFPLYGRSAPHRGHYLNNTNKQVKRPFMLSAGFEPVIPANKRLQTYALDPMATWIVLICIYISTH